MNAIRSIIIFLFLPLSLVAQQKKYKFLIHFTDGTPLSNSKIYIDGNELMTDKQGIINTEFIASRRQVKMVTANKAKYILQSTTEVLLPLDNTLFIQIEVASPKKTTVAKDLQPSIIKKIDKQTKQLEKISNDRKAVAEKARLDLINKIKLDEGRQKFYPVISSELNNYLNEVRNFNDAFRSLSIQINNTAAFEQLQAAILRYNQVFDLLNQDKDKNQQAIAAYWESKELSIKYSSIIDYIIEELHRPYILEINHKFINKINELQTKNKSKRARLEAGLVVDMNAHSEAIDRKLLSVGERIVKMNTELKNNNP